MLTLHHLEYSQSFRILWLLEELGVEYELKKYDRDPQTRLAPDAYKSISPLGTAPVITDGDLVLAETSAIVDYILDQYPESTLRPDPSASNRSRHLFWFHASQGSLMPLMLMEAILNIALTRVPGIIRMVLNPVVQKIREGFTKPRTEAVLRLAEEHLSTADFFSGEQLGAADIVMSYPLEGARVRGYLGEATPRCNAWLERIHARPAFQQAKAKDGRNSMVLPLS